MKNKLLFLTIISASLCLSVNAQVVKSKQQTDEQILRYFKEVVWPRAYREQDTLLLDKLLHDKFKMIEANGDYSDKKLEIEYIKKK